MSRRALVATVAAAVVLGGSAAPALAGSGLLEPTVVCLVTTKDPHTGDRDGLCVWVPVDPPATAAAS